MKPLCQVDYVDRATGATRVCKQDPPNPGKRRVGGLWFCKDCLEDFKQRAMKRGGVGRLNINQAILRAGGDE